MRPMRRACALGKRRGPIPAVAVGSWLARAARALRLPATPPARNTPALPWQGARPLTRRLRPPLPRRRGCVAVWACARVVRLRARGLAGGCAGSPPSGPLRGVAWALHGGGLGGRPLGRPFGRVAPPAVLRVGLCLFPAFVVSSPPAFCRSPRRALSRLVAPRLPRPPASGRGPPACITFLRFRQGARPLTRRLRPPLTERPNVITPRQAPMSQKCAIGTTFQH